MWILLNENINEQFKSNNKYTYLFPINKNNFFIGKNNSGKSYFMRFIMKHIQKIYFNKEDLVREIKELILSTNPGIEKFKESDSPEISNVFKEFKLYENILENILTNGVENGGETWGNIRYKHHNYNNFERLKEEARPLIDFLEIKGDCTTEIFDREIYARNAEIGKKIKNDFINRIILEIEKINEDDIYKLGNMLKSIDFINLRSEANKIFYIPTIRGLRNPIKKIGNAEIQDDIYKDRIISEYEFNEKIKVLTGLDFYVLYKNNLLGNKESRKRVSEFEDFLSKYFFDGNGISIIPDEETFELKININDDVNDKFIYEVGDGIASMIIMMYPIFIEAMKDEYSLFFIEEPENSFHPGFQRLLISMMANYKKFEKCLFFFSTHSNHLIDIGTSEMKNSNVYLCKKDIDNKIEIKYQDDEYNLVLDELGVQASSVRIANKVIWVEGKYDAFYIRMLLNLKNTNKKYIEDYDFCFLPYGGANMKLIDFSKIKSEQKNEEFISKANKINPNFLVILDDDNMEKNKKSEKYKRYEILKEKLGDRIFKLNVREIENLFPDEVVKKFIKDNIIDGSKTDELNIDFNNYKDQKLGNYINNLLKSVYPNASYKDITGRENGFEKEGFLYNKQKYYDTVLEWTKKEDFSYDNDITSEAKELINVIESFLGK